MLKFREFIEKALGGNGVQNDSSDVWVVVDGVQCTVSIDDVLDYEETEPFEASAYLESNLDAPAWDVLYEQYCRELVDSTIDLEEHDEKVRQDAIKECIEIVKFYANQYDGIYWAIREMEDLKERYYEKIE